MSDRPSTTARVAAVLNIPSAILLGIFFFLPWLSWQCSPKSAMELAKKEMEAKGIRQPVHTPSNIPDDFVLGTASGWQVARGRFQARDLSDVAQKMSVSLGVPISKDDLAKFNKPSEEEISKEIDAKPWFYACLGLPIVILLSAFMSQGNLTTMSKNGQLILLLGIAGIVFSVMALNISYVEDLAAHKMSDNPRATQQKKAFEENKEKLSTFAPTKPTPWLWATLGLYIFVSISALLMIFAPPVRDYAIPPEILTSPSPLPPVDQIRQPPRY